MSYYSKVVSSKFGFMTWKNQILVAIACFNFILFSAGVRFGNFSSAYGGDYLAFWSAGEIADTDGYSKIYDLNTLRSVQTQELKILGYLEKTDNRQISPIPAPVFSFFILPFQLLSRIHSIYGYWFWSLSNLIILVGYLFFFLRKILPRSDLGFSYLNLLILVLISYPVYSNMRDGQVQVLLMVCAGEFIRNAIRNKPVLSGIWLGGLLLKPQMLILIIPFLVVSRNWKTLLGFLGSSGIILTTSLLLSGFAGMKAMIDLWTKYSVGIATNAPEHMINWRMIGLSLNTLSNTSIGWFSTVFGIIITIFAAYYLIKRNPPYGKPQWVMTILSVLSATLAVTWHSHYHMALVLIPFLLYASVCKLFPEIIFYLWVIVTPLALLILFVLFFLFAGNFNINYFQVTIVAFSGFILNLAILFCTIHFSNYRGMQKY